jgi:hypothetical protein
MKKKQIPFLLVLAAVVTLLGGCMKKQSFSEIPEIGYLGMEFIYDTNAYPSKGILSISYQDGNGDIGLNRGDTFFPYQPGGNYYYNFVITYFEKQNGVFKQVDLTFPLSARIPVLTPDDPGKAIKGFIDNTMPLPPKPTHDTIRFEAFIYDRALNKSNVITTPEIVLRRR